MNKNNIWLAVALGILFCWLACETESRFDLVIENGLVVDGSGEQPFLSDIGIRRGIIRSLGDLEEAVAEARIDAEERVVAPGFIDLHTHTDRGLLELPLVENYIRQGVTTVLGGNCGSSPLPAGDFLKRAGKTGIAPNFALLVGHNTVRRKVMGRENRAPTGSELDRMKQLVAGAMRDGVFGLSSGLRYVPGIYAKTEEVAVLAEVAAAYGGFYATHIRSEELESIVSVEEALEIGRLAGIPVHISHHKLMGKSMWGKSVETLDLMEAAVERGQDVTFDQYPYRATSTGLTVLFPPWSLAGGQDSLEKRLEDPRTRDRIRQSISFNLRFGRGGGDPASVMIVSLAGDSTLEGLNLAEIARIKGRNRDIDGAAETLIELQSSGGGRGIYHCLDEEDVVRIMKHPLGTVASDGGTVRFGAGLVHPRNYGTFPRVLSAYVREKQVLTLEEAIRKMTALPAARLGLSDRGRIAVGMCADLVLFDPESVEDRATFADPHQYPDRIDDVLVNGVFVVRNGDVTGRRPGEVLIHR